MDKKLSVVSAGFAVIAGVCFVSGIVILTN